MVAREGSWPASAEQRLKELGIELPTPLQSYCKTSSERTRTRAAWYTASQALPLGTPVE